MPGSAHGPNAVCIGIATDFGISVDDPADPARVVKPTTAPAVQVSPRSDPAGFRPNLDQGHVVVQKRQSVMLTKFGKPLQSKVRMGLGWDPAPGKTGQEGFVSNCRTPRPTPGSSFARWCANRPAGS